MSLGFWSSLVAVKDYKVRPTVADDKGWIVETLETYWNSTMMVSRGVLHDISVQEGFAAVQDGLPIGLLTYDIAGEQCEITLMQSMREGIGVGSALIEAARNAAASAGCKRLWLITTNDNLHALGFYQKRGFTLVSVYPNALAKSRELKPGISMIGMNGIPLRDEIELEMQLK